MAAAERMAKFMHEHEPQLLPIQAGIDRDRMITRVIAPGSNLACRCHEKWIFLCIVEHQRNGIPFGSRVDANGCLPKRGVPSFCGIFENGLDVTLGDVKSVVDVCDVVGEWLW